MKAESIVMGTNSLGPVPKGPSRSDELKVDVGFSPRFGAESLVRRVARPDPHGLAGEVQASLARRRLTTPSFPWAKAYGYLRLIATRCTASPGRQIRLIAVKEFSDRFRSGWVLACVLVWLGAIGLTSFLGLLQIGRIGVQGYERTVISLLNLVQYLVPLLGLLLGHDLVVSEQEERTLRLTLAGGVSRASLLAGKFLGGCLSLAVPLLSGFVIAGAVIGLSAKDHAVAPFLRLAVSGLALGVVFLAVGLAISSFSRTRVQALVVALLTWCLAVFVFDLVALGWLVSTRSAVAAHEIEVVCDAMHVNAAADLHSELDAAAERKPLLASGPCIASLGWLALNPVDLFRAVNLADQLEVRMGPVTLLLALTSWLAAMLGVSLWKLRRTDL
jgi:Cu-processing system permease protein